MTISLEAFKSFLDSLDQFNDLEVQEFSIKINQIFRNLKSISSFCKQKDISTGTESIIFNKTINQIDSILKQSVQDKNSISFCNLSDKKQRVYKSWDSNDIDKLLESSDDLQNSLNTFKQDELEKLEIRQNLRKSLDIKKVDDDYLLKLRTFILTSNF